MNKDFLTNTTVKLLAKSEKTRLRGGRIQLYKYNVQYIMFVCKRTLYKPDVSLGHALAYKLIVFRGSVNTLLSPAETWRDGCGAMKPKREYDKCFSSEELKN